MTFEIVLRTLEKDPTYLDQLDCPYSDQTRAFFRRISSPTADVSTAINIFENEDDLQVMDKQIQKVLSDLEGMATQMAKAETNDKINYFKAKTTLIEKLINMKERVFNLKEVSQFRDVVMGFLDQVCSKDQINDLMKRLDGTLGTGDME